MSFNYTVSICRVEIIIVENGFLPDSFVQVPTEIRKITQVCGSNATRPLSQHKIMLMKTLQYGERCVFAQPFLNYCASFHWFWVKFTRVHRVYCHFAGPWRMKFYYSVSFSRVKGNGYGQFGINMHQSITTISAALWSLATRVVLNSSNTKISIGDENSPWHHNYPFLTFILLKPSCNELYQEKLQKSNSTPEFCQKKQGCLTIIVAVKVKEEFFHQSSYRKNMVNYIDHYIHLHTTWCITVHPKDLSASPPCLWLCQLEL